MKHFFGYLTNNYLQRGCPLSQCMFVCVCVCHVPGNVCMCVVSAGPVLHLQYLSVLLHMVSGMGRFKESLTSA